MVFVRRAVTVLTLVLLLPTARAEALERLCDPSFEDCRSPLIDLIRNENVAIDVGFWFMEDDRYVTELVKRKQAGVRIRVLMDTRANSTYPLNAGRLKGLKDAGIPMREKTSSGILHWKMMLFAGQNTVQFSGANYSPHAFVPVTPYQDYVDEAIYFTNDAKVVNSFKTKYDDIWTSTNGYANYANVSGPLTREYPTYSIDAELNFPPGQDFSNRSVSRYNAETVGIDSIMYRITDRRHTDALINARGRGIPVRLISEPKQYRDATRIWHSWNVDRLYMAGVQIRHRKHAGLNHEKLTLLHGQGLTIFGSSNWTSPSANSQLEHNYFTKKPWFFQWSQDHFNRKWDNSAGFAETEPFVPLPPDRPTYIQPADGAVNQQTTVTLRWHAGPWAHIYDIYLGTTPDPPLLIADQELGPSEYSNDYINFTVTGLMPGTTYFWKVRSKTMANVGRNGVIWSFQTSGEAPPPGGSLPSGWTSQDIGAVGTAGSASESSGLFSVSGAGADVWGTSDAFHYAYQTWSGDGMITARVASLAGTDPWTKVGVMMRGSNAPNSAYAFMMVTGGKGLAFQRRRSTGTSALHTSGGSGTAPRWVRLARSGNQITAYVSSDGTSWTEVGSDTISMGSGILVGLATTSHDTTRLATGRFDNVTIGTGAPPPPSGELPPGWSSRDVGSVGVEGSASESGGVFTVNGAGADIWGTSDAFHFAYRSLSGDGTVTARVSSIAGTEAWTKMGVMVRGSTSSSSAFAMMLVSLSKGLAFQRRTANGASAVHTSGGSGTAPRWVRLTRTGAQITASVSTNGSSWTTVGTDTFALPGTVLVGLAASSHSTSALARGRFDNVTVSSSTSTSTLPSGWSSQDVGPVGPAGSASESDGVFTVSGAGADVWGVSDAFHYAFRSLTGDGAITARVASIAGSEAWTKMGVMIRDSIAAGSAYAYMLVSVSKGLAFQRRPAEGTQAVHTSGGAGTAPRWVRLEREGDVITASVSDDGSAWMVVGSDTVSMTGDVLVGLAATSHDDARLATGTFDNVDVAGS